jgi:ATP-dependent RNA helicase DHX57
MGKRVSILLFAMMILRGEGATTSIVVTQPRRVSAIGVASRVAQERCDARGERGRLQSCRTGRGTPVRRDARLGSHNRRGSHIFIDEVHERSVDSDFLLLELRDILERNPNIKVVQNRARHPGPARRSPRIA